MLFPTRLWRAVEEEDLAMASGGRAGKFGRLMASLVLVVLALIGPAWALTNGQIDTENRSRTSVSSWSSSGQMISTFPKAR
jgi:hypothetical protein